LRVDADNWMAALKAGMTKLGEQGSSVQNVLVDIQDDNTIHVTEPKDGRVFRIKEMSEEEAARAPIKRPSQIRPAPQQAARTEPAMPALKLGNAAQEAKTQPMSRDTQIDTQPGGSPTDHITEPARKPGPPRPGTRPGNKSSPRIDVNQLRIDELQKPSTPSNRPIGRPRSAVGMPAVPRVSVEDILADIFDRVQAIHSKPTSEDALAFVLDLALEKVPADSGSVFRADYATGDLTFAVARGPKAKELLASRIIVPAGSGIAGFCSMEGVSLAISDVDKDPRHYTAVADKVDYEITSLACAPMMTHGRSFGCVQLINKKGSHTFADHEIGIISYLAHQAALYLNNRA